jgi:hypothetical protein
VDRFTQHLIARLRAPLVLMPPWLAHPLDGQRPGSHSLRLSSMVVGRLKLTWSPTRRRRMIFMWSLGEKACRRFSCNRIVSLSC